MKITRTIATLALCAGLIVTQSCLVNLPPHPAGPPPHPPAPPHPHLPRASAIQFSNPDITQLVIKA